MGAQYYAQATLCHPPAIPTSLPMTVREWTSGRGPSGDINGGGPRFAIQADRGRVRLRQAGLSSS
jgi:hypothetical protein